jgi:transposase
MDAGESSKRRALQAHGTLNPRPQAVQDPLFNERQAGGFFDPQDLVQVKYEMLRRVRVDDQSVTDAAQAYGFSRVAFYQILAAFEQDGLPGLVPKRRGPKEAHKLTAPVLEFIDQQRADDPKLRAAELARRVQKHWGLSVHPRSIERALARRASKGQ